MLQIVLKMNQLRNLSGNNLAEKENLPATSWEEQNHGLYLAKLISGTHSE